MTQGRRYRLRSDSRAYPRHFSYRNKLDSVFSRVQRLLETNDLLTLLDNGQQNCDQIRSDKETCIGNSSGISLYVFTFENCDVDDIKGELFRDKTVFEENSRRRLPREEIGEAVVDWGSLSQQTDGHYEQNIVVYAIGQSEERNSVEERIAGLSDVQRDRLIVFDQNINKSWLYESWVDADRPDKQSPLCQNVEFLLERNVIRLLEDVLSFVEKFVPRKDDLHMSVGKIAKTVISSLQKDFGQLKFLKELLPANSEEELSEENVREFHEKIQTTLARKTKFMFHDLVCKKLGISSPFVHEFMNEAGFEHNFQDGITTDALPAFPIDHGLKELKEAFQPLVGKCQDLCNRLIPEAEGYVNKKYQALDTLKKIQFEIFGLLRSNPRCRTVKLPDDVKVTKPLLDELMGLDYVDGCGCLYGILAITVTQDQDQEDLDSNQRKTIIDILKKHKYHQEYEVKVKFSIKEHAPTRLIEHGHGIVSEFAPGGKDKFMKEKSSNVEDVANDYVKGSLGCFVEPVTGEGLYAVTCYHCIQEDYFQEDIKVQMAPRKDFDDFGVRSHWLYDKYTLDIGLIKVHEHMLESCDKTLVKEDELMKCIRWKFSDSPPADGLPVYKKGLITFTRGIIAGYEFKTKSMAELKDKGFDDHFNIFITNRPGEVENQIFSEDGDSGSVVCTEIIPQDDPSYVEVISLLCGSITLKDPDNQAQPAEVLTYSCQLRGLLDELTKQKGCPALKEAVEEEIDYDN